MSQNFNQGFNNQNFPNQNMNMNMNMNMYNNMNYMQMQNELLKCVMEGMGEQPSDDMAKNWDTIINFVPKLESANFSQNLGIGKIITLIFSDALDVKISEKFDLIVIDAAKSKNLDLSRLHRCYPLGDSVFKMVLKIFYRSIRYN